MAGARNTAGKYRTRVTIQSATRTLNSMNEPEYTWSTYATRWGELAPTNGREYLSVLQTQAQVAGILRLRSDTQTRAITPDMRCVVGSRTLNIGAVYDETDAKKEMVIWFSEPV